MRRTLFRITFVIAIVIALALILLGVSYSFASPIFQSTATQPFLCFDSVGEPYILVPLKTQLFLTESAPVTPTRIFVTSSPSNTPPPTPILCSVKATGVVLAQKLNVRSGPGVNNVSLRVVAANDGLLIAEIRGDWARLCSDRMEWVAIRAADGTQLVRITLR